MKRVDMDTVVVVHSGEQWEHEQPPCSRQMIRYLEKNEGLVTWVQPKGGAVKDQYPVLRIHGECYTMSLRMMKAVWRSVRLRRGFVNLERAPFGGEKLRIPSLLFVEKMRTQSRFNLMRVAPAAAAAEGGGGRKVSHNASSKVAVVVERMLLPMLDAPMRGHVVFDALEGDQDELDLVDEVDRRHPGAVADAGTFLGHMAALYERYMASYYRKGGAYSAV